MGPLRREGGVKVVLDVVDHQVADVTRVLGDNAFDVTRYYPDDRATGPGRAAPGWTRLGAERARRFTPDEQAEVAAAAEVVLRGHGRSVTVVGVDTWVAGGDDGGAGVREPRRPRPRVATGASTPAASDA